MNELDSRLWKAADKLRPHLDAANYKHIVLGYIFLKYISDTFVKHREQLKARFTDPKDDYHIPQEGLSEQAYAQELETELEDRNYYTAANIFWIPQGARWQDIQNVAAANIGSPLPWGGKHPGIAQLIDQAFEAIERDNPKLKGIIQRISGYQVEAKTHIDLINLFSDTAFTRPTHNGQTIELPAKDILGHVYEYFLGQFALAEGKKGGQYFTPKSIVSLIIEILRPWQGRIFDPACGSGGFFVQTERFIRAHAGTLRNISIYGQESNRTTWRLAAMNLVIRNMEYNLGRNPADSFTDDQHPDLRADYVMANPPFNSKDWWHESLEGDPRWKYGTPPQTNANFAWMQHMLHHLNPTGRMALLLANGSMSTVSGGEGQIRENLIKADLVEIMIALPGQLFTNTQIPACIWILNKAKPRKGETLFIDARQMGYMKDRVLRDFHPEDIARIATTCHNWQQNQNYENQAGYSYSATLEDITAQNYILTPGRYVGSPEQEDDGIPFAEKMQTLTEQLYAQLEESAELEKQIRANLAELGYPDEP